MFRRLFCVLLVLLCLPAAACAHPCEQWVRLHVVAEGDGAYQQALKMKIRDACLECAALTLANAQDADEAYMRLEESVGLFEQAATRRARESGYLGSVRAEVGVFTFPERVYGGVIVPAGEYRALRVVIGEGAGHNWWCVLYPTLCFADESSVGEIPPRKGLFYELFLKWRAMQ